MAALTAQKGAQTSEHEQARKSLCEVQQGIDRATTERERITKQLRQQEEAEGLASLNQAKELSTAQTARSYWQARAEAAADALKIKEKIRQQTATLDKLKRETNTFRGIMVLRTPLEKLQSTVSLSATVRVQ